MMQQTSFLPRYSYDRLIATLTDSSGGDVGSGCYDSNTWSSILCNRLNAPELGAGCVRMARSPYSGRATCAGGNNGLTSFKTLLRPYRKETPKLAIISMGVNDPGGVAIPVAGITRSGTTATATYTDPHQYPNGQSVTFAGAGQSQYNITASVTVVDAYTVTYTVSGSPATPATGTITSNGAGAISNAQTILNLEAIILGLMYNANGNGLNGAICATETNLPAGNSNGWGHDGIWQPERMVVLADSAANGGATSCWTPSNALATINTAGTGGLGVWECVVPGVAGTAGWRRVANVASVASLAAGNSGDPPGIPYILICGAWYLNFASGGGDVTKTCTGIVRSGTTATATVTAHGWSNGDHVNIPNASAANLCGSYIIANVTANTFDYTVANTGATSVGACNATKMYTAYDDLSGGVRYAQKQVVSAFGNSNAQTGRVLYCDQWAAEQARITAGYTTQGSGIYNLLANDQHRSVAGHDLFAATLYNTITAWTAAMNYLQFPV